MTIEQEFFIQVLRDFIKGEKTRTPENVDIERITSYGKKHELSAILYQQTRIPQFLSAYSSTVYSNANRSRMMRELMNTIVVPYFIIKGSVVAELYPIPAVPAHTR